MATRHDTRRLAMQVLYQFDLRGPDDAQTIRQNLEDDSGSGQPVQDAFDLAQAAWDQRSLADTLASELAPHWPTHRQPPLDRALIRLAYYEMKAAHAPPRVVINEAIVLAKQYCSKQSSGFINAILDKMAKRLHPTPADDPVDAPPHQGPSLIDS